MGVEEPLAAIHALNERVDPGEIERLAMAEALFLQRFAAAAAAAAAAPAPAARLPQSSGS